MSLTIYNKAFAVELSHDFYIYTSPSSPAGNEFKVNTDFEIFPTAETEALMQRGRMRFLRTLKGLFVFYKAYRNGSNVVEPLVKVDNGAEFVFGVRLKSNSVPQFTTITNLNLGSKTYSGEKIVILDKTAGGVGNPLGQLLDGSLANMLRPAVFTYAFKPNPASVLNADVVVKSGAVVVFSATNVPYSASTNSYSLEINISQQPKGFYTITAYNTGTLTQINSSDFYLDGDLLSQNVFGVISIKFDVAARLYDSSVNPNDFRTFNYPFVARSTKWRYYIVPKTIDTTSFDLAVIDADGNHTFTPVNPATPPYGNPTTLMTINGVKPVIVESSAPIPFSEKTLPNLAVWKTDGTASPVINGIANANINGVDSDQLGAAQLPPTITSGISEIFVIV
ncbi:MAG: hypothetical protein M3R17_21365 [Bacteroidota bacterium]|nr:hypothetical protein [Bacteroidota bacterium]